MTRSGEGPLGPVKLDEVACSVYAGQVKRGSKLVVVRITPSGIAVNGYRSEDDCVYVCNADGSPYVAPLEPCVPPVEGKRARLRNGWVTPPMKMMGPNEVYPFYVEFDDGGESWLDTGQYFPDGPSPRDVVEVLP
jgi:hypothetical protein